MFIRTAYLSTRSVTTRLHVPWILGEKPVAGGVSSLLGATEVLHEYVVFHEALGWRGL